MSTQWAGCLDEADIGQELPVPLRYLESGVRLIMFHNAPGMILNVSLGRSTWLSSETLRPRFIHKPPRQLNRSFHSTFESHHSGCTHWIIQYSHKDSSAFRQKSLGSGALF